jgi:hypothetical protein
MLLDDYTVLPLSYTEDLSWQSISGVIAADNTGMFGRPVSQLSFILNHHLVPGDAQVFHFKIVNLVLHLINGLLLYQISRRLVRCFDPRLTKEQSRTMALLVACAWLAHPFLVSTVLYTVQRMAELSALFTLSGILLYLVARRRIEAKKRFGVPLLYGGFMASLILGFLSKENGILLPLYLLAIEWVVFGFRSMHATAQQTLRRFHLVCVLLPVAAGVAYLVYSLPGFVAGYENRTFTLTERLYTQAHIIWDYLARLLVPDIARMGLFHDDFPVTGQADWLTLTKIGGLVGLLALIPLLRKRWPVLALGVAWFFIGHLLESTVIALELYYEHRNYLPAYGVLLPLVYSFWHPLASSARIHQLRQVAIVVFVAFLVFFTTARVDVWASEERFYDTALKQHPGSFRANMSLALLKMDDQQFLEARSFAETAARLEPRLVSAVAVSIMTWCQGQRVPDRLVTQAQLALDQYGINGEGFATLNDLVFRFLNNRCSGLTASQMIAVAHSGYAGARVNDYFRFYLGLLYGRVLMHAQRYDEARQIWEAVIPLRNHVPAKDQLQPLIDLVNLAIYQKESERARTGISRLKALDRTIAHDYGALVTALQDSVDEMEKDR